MIILIKYEKQVLKEQIQAIRGSTPVTVHPCMQNHADILASYNSVTLSFLIYKIVLSIGILMSSLIGNTQNNSLELRAQVHMNDITI